MLYARSQRGEAIGCCPTRCRGRRGRVGGFLRPAGLYDDARRALVRKQCDRQSSSRRCAPRGAVAGYRSNAPSAIDEASSPARLDEARMNAVIESSASTAIPSNICGVTTASRCRPAHRLPPETNDAGRALSGAPAYLGPVAAAFLAVARARADRRRARHAGLLAGGLAPAGGTRQLALCFPQNSLPMRASGCCASISVASGARSSSGHRLVELAERLRRTVQIEGEEHIKAREGKPVIWLGSALRRHRAGGSRITLDYRGGAVYSRQKDPHSTAILKRKRERFAGTRILRGRKA